MKTILSIMAIAVFLGSCDTPRYAYSPSAHNVPILIKKGDSKLAADYSNNGVINETGDNQNQYDKNIAHGFDLQGALAVSNHIALQANYFYRREKTNSGSNYYTDSNRVRYKRNMFDFGAGFYATLDSKDRILFQVYGGAGFGKTEIADNGKDFNQVLYSKYYHTNLIKYYIEPSLTFRVKEIFAASIATRASIVQFRNINTNYTLSEKQEYNLDSLNRFPVVFFEPAFVGSFGFPKLPGFRLELQAGLCLLWDDSFIDYRPFNFSLGLVFDIRKLAKGRNK